MTAQLNKNTDIRDLSANIFTGVFPDKDIKELDSRLIADQFEEDNNEAWVYQFSLTIFHEGKKSEVCQKYVKGMNLSMFSHIASKRDEGLIEMIYARDSAKRNFDGMEEGLMSICERLRIIKAVKLDKP